MPMDGQRMTKIRTVFYKMVKAGRELLGSLLFPPRCLVCDEILSPEEIHIGIHSNCKKKLYPICGATCMHCGRMLGRYSDYIEKRINEHLEHSTSAEYCFECRNKGYVPASSFASSAKKLPFNNTNKISIAQGKPWIAQGESSITQGKSLYLYRGAIKQIMYRFKYGNRREYARVFARQTVEKYGDWIKKNQIQAIVPVPMYMPKQRKRGYNQAESFARELSLLTGIPMDKNLIKRTKDTTPQKELNDIERKNNLKNAFQNQKSIVQYSHILVVDDIYTTGSTAQAVAKELIKIGVRRVYFMSVCIGGDM